MGGYGDDLSGYAGLEAHAQRYPAAGAEAGCQSRQVNAGDLPQKRDSKDLCHFFQLWIGVFQPLKGVGIEHRQHHQEGNEGGEPLSRKPQQSDDNKGGHRHGLNGQHIGPQQHLRPGERRRQAGQDQGQHKGQEEAQADP